MLEFQVNIVDEDDAGFCLSNPKYFFAELCYVSMSLAERKLELQTIPGQVFVVEINDMSIGGRLHPFSSFSIWGSMEIEKVRKNVRVDLYIPEKEKMEEKFIVPEKEKMEEKFIVSYCIYQTDKNE